MRAKVKKCELSKPFPDVLRTPWKGRAWEEGRQNYLV